MSEAGETRERVKRRATRRRPASRPGANDADRGRATRVKRRVGGGAGARERADDIPRARATVPMSG